MKKSRQWLVFGCGAMVLAATGASAQTPTFSLWLTEVNDAPCAGCPLQTVPLGIVDPGDTIRVEAYVEGWDDMLTRGKCSGNPPQFGQPCNPVGGPGACVGKHCSDTGNGCNSDNDCNSRMCVPSTCIPYPRASAFQWTVDSDSYFSGMMGELAPAQIPCAVADCTHIQDGLCPCAQFYVNASQCTCAFNNSCMANGFCNPQGSVFVETVLPNFLFYQEPAVLAVSTTSPDYEIAGALSILGGVTDMGTKAYIGTLLLTVSNDARGTFTLRMDSSITHTFLNDNDAAVLSPNTLQPLVINTPVMTCTTNAECQEMPNDNPCTTDTCVNMMCQRTNNTMACNDSNGCTLNDACANGVCSGTPRVCNDSNPCTDDSCVGGNCQFTNNNANTCSDSLNCTTNDHCNNGACVGTSNCPAGQPCNGPPPGTCGGCTTNAQCQEQPNDNPCTTDTCVNSVCQRSNNTIACNDNNGCTLNDVCANGACTGTPRVCDDMNACTDDSCVSGNCVFTNDNTNTCSDNLTCTSDVCTNGTCVSTSTCPAGQTCTPNGCVGGGQTCVAIASSVMPDCEIDARQPHPVAGPVNPRQGFDRMVLTMSPADCTASTLTASNFTLQFAPGPAPAGFAISSVMGAGNVVTVIFNQVIPVKHWTCVRGANGVTGKACNGYLPGDVNKSRASNAQDITAIVNALNNVTPRPLLATDANRSGAANAQDIPALINLLNGAGQFGVSEPGGWLNKTIPVVCPP